ncbi:probable aspartyl protease At4g16563 [Mercurialis annua]|uniref:probable aspartyl protease At4g16563 n=1 Tax=Mercurialis annua TaxID=3986 RepID=UPI00216007D1|nr:probable aspartyl protease At4g16563 [Mercurialis annua]
MAIPYSYLLLFISFLLFPFASPSTIKIPISPAITKHPSSSDPLKLLNQLASISISRAHHLKSAKSDASSSPIKAPLFSRSYGGYSMSLGFGTPSQTVNLIMDTGSSLLWVPCTSRYLCDDCNFPNTDISKIAKFIPNLSSSTRIIGCANKKCGWIFGSTVLSKCPSCSSNPQNCTEACPPYIIEYGLGSTAGRLLSENLNFPNKTIPDFLVGCSLLSTRQPEGIAGFGRSSYSLPGQLGLSKFSYCLVSRNFDDSPVSSDLILEMGPSSSGDTKTAGVSYTPFLRNPGNNGSNPAFQEYYYVMLRKIIVGSKDIKVPYSFLVPSGSDGSGGTIVDSGTTFTFMEGHIFNLLSNEFEKQMANYTKAAEVEKQTGLKPCYDISGEKSDVLVPELIFQFKGGAKLQFALSNYFAFVDKGVICLTIVSDTSGSGGGVRSGPAIILGNFQQQNLYVEYDLENDRFGFKEQSCV